MVREVSKILFEIHQHGMCHRDLKANNIFVDKDSNNCLSFKLGDFNVSKNYLEYIF